jgi:hypothetical protein
MPQFELWDKRAAGKVRTPTITVQRKGILSLNSSAAHLIAGGEHPGDELPVELLYAKAEEIIGIRKAATEHPSVYIMRKQKQSDSYLISARAFTIYHAINTDESRRFTAHDYGNGIIGVALTDNYTSVNREVEGEEAEAVPKEE